MKRQRRSVSWLVTVALVIGLVPGVSIAGGFASDAEASALPTGTLVYVSMAGLDEMEAQLRTTGLWKVGEKIPPLAEAVRSGWREVATAFEQETQIPFDTVWKVLGGKMTFALTDLDIQALKSEEALPGFVWSLDLTGREAQWQTLWDKFVPMFKEEIERRQDHWSESDWNGSTLYTVGPKGKDGFRFFGIVRDGKFVLASRADLLQSVFLRPSHKTLKDDPDFSWVYSKVGGDNLALFYLNAGAITELIRPLIVEEGGKEAQMVFDILALDTLAGLGYSMSIVHGGVLDRVALGYGTQADGIVKLMAKSQGAPLTSIRMAPEDSILYSAGNLGAVKGLYDDVLGLLKEKLPTDVHSEMDAALHQALAEFKKETNFDLVEDVLASLSG